MIRRSVAVMQDLLLRGPMLGSFSSSLLGYISIVLLSDGGATEAKSPVAGDAEIAAEKALEPMRICCR